MKAYLFISGTIFALFAGWHFYIGYEHWQRAGATLLDWTGPGVIGLAGGALAVWACRLMRLPPRAAV